MNQLISILSKQTVRKHSIYFALSLMLFIGCSSKDFESYFDTEKFSRADFKNVKIVFDTIYLDKIESSYVGAMDYIDTQILFVDYKFCWVYLFDINGKLTDRKLGQGKGPYELNLAGIDAFCFLENGKHIFFGSTNDIVIHDKTWKRELQAYIDWKGRVRVGSGQTIKNPSPLEPSIYALDPVNLKPKSLKNSVFLPIYSEHTDFNGFTGYNYYKESSILAELNTETIEVDRIFGRRTPELLKYKYLMHHASFNFDLDSLGNFYIAHEIDPLIYVYNNKFKIQYAFGIAGTNMNTDYQELNILDLKKFRQLYFNDRPNRGYYTGIKVFIDQGLVFRTYKKSSESMNDGLQVYKDKILILDIDVPLNFKVNGYIPPFYYSDAILDEEKEEIKVIRFKFEDNF